MTVTAKPSRFTLELAAYAARDQDGVRRMKAASWQFLFILATLGEKGLYPGDDRIGKIMRRQRTVALRARDDLERRGLLVLSGTHNSRQYALRIPQSSTGDTATAISELCGQPVPAPTAPPVEVVVPVPQETSEPAPQQTATPPEVVPAAAPDLVPQESPKGKIKLKKLSPEAQAWFLSSPENMTLYIRFGADAYQKTLDECKTTLKSTGTDWLVFNPANPNHPFFDNGSWNANHYMGYYWHHVCLWRAKNNIPLTLPQWSRLAGSVAGLLRTMTPWGAFCYVWRVANHFDLIRFRLGKIGENMMLDEASLDHRLIKEQAMILESFSEEKMKEEYERMANPQSRSNGGGEYHVG